jgi:signal transduction histidine kinase
VAAFVVSQRSVNAWGQVVPAAAAHDVLSLCLYLLVVIIAMALLRAYRDKHVEERGVYDRLNETSLRLADANMKLQEYATLKEEEATRSERKRVAQEIHDTLAYTLTNLIMMMEAGLSLARPEDDELREVLSEARTQAKDGLGEVRRAVEALQPTLVKRTAGLRAVYNLVQSIRKATGVRVDLHMGDVPWSFGEEADGVVFRFVQESITNAMRHGKASEVSVFFARSGPGALITVRDDGVGSDHVEPGFGLKGMEDRFARLGGRIGFYSQVNRGFRVEAWIPLAKEQDREENQSASGG